MLCWSCPGDEVHLVLECAALQGLRDYVPVLFCTLPSRLSCKWQENKKPMSNHVQGAMRLVRPASFGDDLDV